MSCLLCQCVTVQWGTFQNWQEGHRDTQPSSYTSKGGGQREADAFA